MKENLISPRNILCGAWTVLILAISACGNSSNPPDSWESLTSPSKQDIATFPVISENRRLILDYPARIRVGDSDVVRLTFALDDTDNPVPVVDGDDREIPNLYDTHHIIAEAKFEIPGMPVTPSDLVSQTLSEGQSATFHWQIHPQKEAIYRGTVWFYLRFVNKVSGEESRKAISAQIVEIKAVDFMGLPAGVIRTFGVVGLVIGFIVGYPLLRDVARIIFGDRRK